MFSILDQLATDSRVIRVPAGMHVHERPVTISRPVRFECEPGAWFVCAGKSLFVGAANDVQFVGGGFRNGSLLMGNTIEMQYPYRNWSFKGCEFDGCMVTLANATPDVPGTSVSENCRIKRCTFANIKTQHALLLRNAHNIDVTRCKFVDCGISAAAGDAIKVTSLSHGVRIIGCDFQDIARDAIDLYFSNHVTVSGCSMQRCGMAIDAKWRKDNPCGWYHRITDNTASDCGGGFSINTSKAYVAGNVALRCGGDGYRCVSASDDLSVPCEESAFIGNRAERCGRNGFYIAGRSNTAFGNVAVRNAKKQFVFGENVNHASNVETA